MKKELPPLTSYSDDQRQKAMNKYNLIAPYLNYEKNLKTIAQESGVSKRTLQYWISKYQQFGLIGLIYYLMDLKFLTNQFLIFN